jgi:predicted AAA+ superfamily ATPase
MIHRWEEKNILELLHDFPCVALIGPRQVGKTTLAKNIQKQIASSLYLDLESISDSSRLDDAETYLVQNEEKLVVIDEVQRGKDLFPLLRSLIDRKRTPGRFLLLGSASPDLIRDSSESLAGRIIYIELTPITLPELPPDYSLQEIWMYGGFPEALLKQRRWATWMNDFIRTYFERDLPQLGFPASGSTGRRLWTMLSHYHGNIIQYSELGKSLGLSIPTIKSYIAFLEKAFLIRILEPYYSNVKKRLVKSPKVYIRDSGLLHFLLGVDSFEELNGHPKIGASWEGFVIEQILTFLPKTRHHYFYRTHDGAELDLVITKGDTPVACIEIKYGSDIRPTRGNTEAMNTLKTKKNFLISNKEEDYSHSSGFHVCGLRQFLQTYSKDL